MNEEQKKKIAAGRIIDEAHKAMLVPLVVDHYNKFIKTDEYRKILNDMEFTEAGKDSLIVLSIYSEVQKEITSNEMNKLFLNEDMNSLKRRIVELTGTVQSLEEELYTLQSMESDEHEDHDCNCMNSFYGCLPNEKISLFEVIEEVVNQRKG